MYSKVIQVRHRGVRRSERDLANDPGVFGAVTLVGHGMHLRMEISAWGVSNRDGLLLPTLWDARCITWHSGRMIWQGFQHASLTSSPEAAAYFQEWRVELLGEYPEKHN